VNGVNNVGKEGWPQKGVFLSMNETYEHTTIHKFTSIKEEESEDEVSKLAEEVEKVELNRKLGLYHITMASAGKRKRF
jgi:hypothetical protein